MKKKWGGGEKGGMQGEVTPTAGVSWDAGQDVDSLFHLPSVFILPTIPCLHSLLLLIFALTYCIFLCLDLPLPYLISCLSLFFFFLSTNSSARLTTALYCIKGCSCGLPQTVQSIPVMKEEDSETNSNDTQTT